MHSLASTLSAAQRWSTLLASGRLRLPRAEGLHTTTSTPPRSPNVFSYGRRRHRITSASPQLPGLGSLCHSRTFLTPPDLHPALLAPAVFTGLLLTLWLYKSLMLVLFQEKIIYMPYMPPFARGERIGEYATMCGPVVWREERVRVGGDEVEVGLCVGRMFGRDDAGAGDDGGKGTRRVVLCYFHGNGGSLPPRLPMLSNVLRSIHTAQQRVAEEEERQRVEVVLVAFSYRGYWTSSGKPSQAGIERDAQALLQWVNDTYSSSSSSFCSARQKRKGDEPHIILWGQSLGAGVASTAAATYCAPNAPDGRLPLTALILETPFTSIKSMLLELYPQKWLPYRYLSPFLRSHWDSEAALRDLAAAKSTASGGGGGVLPRTLILSAGNDELVPEGEAEKLERLCGDLGLEGERREVRGALHNDATVKREGREAVAGFVVDVVGAAGGAGRRARGDR